MRYFTVNLSKKFMLLSKPMLLFALISCFLINTNQAQSANYVDSMGPKCISSNGGQVDFTFSNVPLPTDSVTIKFYAGGDLVTADTNKYAQLWDENSDKIPGAIIGQPSSPSSAQPGPNSYGGGAGDTVGYLQVKLSAEEAINWWKDDQNFDFTVDFGPSVSLGYGTSGVNDGCAYIVLDYSSNPASHDAGIQEFISPTAGFCGSNVSVKVDIQNFGTQQIDSVDVNWAVNGNVRTSTKFLGTLDTAGGSGNNTALINLGSYSTSAKDTIEVWTSNPNGNSDGYTVNDTLVNIVSPDITAGLGGVYNVDPSGNGDFTDISSAASALNQYGICESVTINIEPGYYNEQVSLGKVNGSSSNNTITFKASQARACTLAYSATSNNASWTFRLNGSEHVKIEDMVIRTLGNSYGVGVQINGTASHLTVRDCEIECVNGSFSYNGSFKPVSIGEGINASGRYYQQTNGEHQYVTIDSNKLIGGGYGVAVKQSYVGFPTQAVVRANTMRGVADVGIIFNNTDGAYAMYNDIKLSSNQGYGYGIMTYNAQASGSGVNPIDSTQGSSNYIVGNRLVNISGSGLQCYTSATQGSSPGKIINNMVQASGGYFGSDGMYWNYFGTIDVAHNSIYSTGTGMDEYGTNNLDLLNNSIIVDGNATPLVIDPPNELNFNNYYTNGNTLAEIGGTTYDSSNIQGASGYNEVFFNHPSIYKGAQDLHLVDTQAYVYAPKLSNVPTDIDGDQRNLCPNLTAVGADESTVSPAAGGLNPQFTMPDTVKPKSPYTLRNQSDNVFSITYTWKINGSILDTSYDIKTTFNQVGKDTVTLIAASCGTKDSTTKIVDVVVAEDPPNSDFIADKNVIQTGSSVSFTDLSTNGPSQWDWTIKPYNTFVNLNYIYTNGTDSTSQDPVVAFLQPGLYEVCLTASNDSLGVTRQGNTNCKSQFIEVLPPSDICSAGSSSDTSGLLYDDGEQNNYGNYKDCNFVISTCADSIKLELLEFELKQGDYLRVFEGQDDSGKPLWDMNRYSYQGMSGSITASDFEGLENAQGNTVYIEFDSDNSGTAQGFELKWQAYGKGGNASAPVADFSGPDTVCTGDQVSFINQTTPSGRNVEFGWHSDSIKSTPDSRSENFNYTADSTGVDSVFLVSTNCGGADTIVKEVFVRDLNTNLKADFEANVTTPVSGRDTVRFSNLSSGCDTAITWSISPDSSISFVNGTDENSEHPEVVFEENICYDVNLSIGNPATSDSENKLCYIKPIDICLPEAYNLNPDLGISQVQLGGISNRSSIGYTDYNDYSHAQNTDLERGATYGITLSRRTSLNKMTRKVWIDFNENGVFESSELVLAEHGANTVSYTDSFKVPTGVSLGAKRMRVAAGRGNLAIEPCGPIQYGEYEDYRVYIRRDLTAPVITLNGGDTLKMEACDTLSKRLPGFNAIDNVQGNITDSVKVEFYADTSTPGTYNITYNVADTVGNQAEEKNRILVVEPDTTKPEIMLKDSAHLVHQVFEAYDDSGYSANDICSGLASVDTMNTVSVNTIGTYQVEYTAYDSAGNQNTVSRTVEVVDTVEPEITLKGNDTIYHQVGTAYVDSGVSYDDNYWPNPTLITNVTNNVQSNELGTYKVNYSVEDSSGNGPVIKTRTVIVEDRISPDVRLVQADTFELNVFNELKDNMVVFNISDNYYNSDSIELNRTGEFFNFFPTRVADSLGYFNASYVVTDPSGNSDTFTQLIHVIDQTAPDISLIGPDIVELERWNETPYTDSVEITDNYYDTSEIQVVTSGTYFTGYVDNDYPSGTFVIDYKAVDGSGNESGTVKRLVAIETTTGTEGIDQKQLIEVYPNPSNGQFSVGMDFEHERDVQIKVFDQLGKVMHNARKTSVKNGEYEIDLTGEAAGVYQLMIKTPEETFHQRLVITQ